MKKYSLILLTIFFCIQCDTKDNYNQDFSYLNFSKDILDYHITPENAFDKNGLMFSDQGAWFAYGISNSKELIGFTGPFLLTEQNGIWSSVSLAKIDIKNIDWKTKESSSYASHLEQSFRSSNIELKQKLVFLSGHTGIIETQIKNISDKKITLEYEWKQDSILAKDLDIVTENNQLLIRSDKTDAVGLVLFLNGISSQLELEPKETEKLLISQSFIFPEYDWSKEKERILTTDCTTLLSERKTEKNNQLKRLINSKKEEFKDSLYSAVLAKAHLTLQNNWRIPAGEVKFEGMFPSYHYRWFNGFWSWDTWKQAVGTSSYDIRLAKEQMKQLFYFQKDNGFVPDVVYRDTSIEEHNLRDTKPPLSAWAVYKIYEKDKDVEFVKYMYPRLKSYHNWWYSERDHDQDGLCEYGSTDGSLIAAKWESGMDNAIRFDNSKILKNKEGAYSLDQESVDLNSYLYAEKLYLAKLSKALENDDYLILTKEAEALKNRIQKQFYDPMDGWFYDTNLDGDKFIKGEGSEGWTPLWTKVANQKQANSVISKMMDPQKFYTKVPFQTMSADHPKFDPLKGYWRGPNWLDQSYFGVKGLQNFGYHKEANAASLQILKGAEGILEKGKSIRENYHPITGEGLHARNFSWSAAHIIMILSEE